MKMARTVDEWRGRNDDAMPPKSVKLRICERQGFKCALTGRPFREGDVVHYDHAVPLWLGGENRETNLQAVLAEPHRRKTATEAAVRAKVKRLQESRAGIKKQSSFPKRDGMKFNWAKGRYEKVDA